MPLFRFLCKSCGQEAELFLSLGEVNRGMAACPHCKSKDMEGPLPGTEYSGGQGQTCSLGKKT